MIKKQRKFKIFVYGNCQRGLSEHRMLKNAKYEGLDYINGWLMLDMGGMAMVIKPRSKMIKPNIVVEVYTIMESEIFKFDSYYKCPKNMTRELVKSGRGVLGILYFAEEHKSAIKGRGYGVPNGDWQTYQKKKEKKEKRRKERREEEDKTPAPREEVNLNNQNILQN